MIIDKINKVFDRYGCKLVFLFDEGGVHTAELDQVKDQFKVLKVTNNYFKSKYMLEFELIDEPRVLVYEPIARPAGKRREFYPLLDLLLANQELRLDEAAEFMEQFGIPGAYSNLIKTHLSVLSKSTNQKKLIKILDRDQFNEQNLKLGLVSIALDFSQVATREECLIKWLILSLDDKKREKANKLLEENQVTDEFKHWIALFFNQRAPELDRIFAEQLVQKLKYEAITHHINFIAEEDTYHQHLALKTEQDKNRLFALFNQWQADARLKKNLSNVFAELGEDVKENKILDWYGPAQQYGYHTDGVLEQVFTSYFKRVESEFAAIKEEVDSWNEQEDLAASYQQIAHYLAHAVGFYETVNLLNENEISSPEEHINRYINTGYAVDFHFRKASQVYDAIKHLSISVEEEVDNAYSQMSEVYGIFIKNQNVSWQKEFEKVAFDYQTLTVEKQYDFYSNHVLGFENKIVVLISDAFRFELAHELFERLDANAKNAVRLDGAISSIPSYTNLGMSNLLPNVGMTAEDADSDLSYKVGDLTTVSHNRQAILQEAAVDSQTIDYPSLKKMDKKAIRAFFKEARITYVYHDWMDAIGDKKVTEHEAFNVTEKALEDINWVVQKVVGEVRIMNMIVTSDHGFLYVPDKLEEKDREDFPKTTGLKKGHARFAIAESFEDHSGYQLPLRNTTNLDTDLQVALPRAVNRFRRKGNVGLQFVHGGASLQELVIPVLKINRSRDDLGEMVTFKRFDDATKINAGVLKLLLFQDEAVKEGKRSADIVIGLYGEDGSMYSKEESLSLNSTSGNPKDRITEKVLTLNTAGSKAKKCLLKAFGQKDRNRMNPFFEYEIQINTLTEIDEW